MSDVVVLNDSNTKADAIDSLNQVIESVLNIERVAQCVIQLGTLPKAETANGGAGEKAQGQRHDVVARDHTRFGQSFFGPDSNFRTYPANRSRNRSARQGRENFDGCISRQYAHRAPASRAPQVGPDDVAPGYQFGIVSLASRAATPTTIGSWGVKR